ncbi:MAG TPA: 16S rRNA (adenine(1518)-N(6)/adenine(1519)-N(6))-dimethyltransferase RsmA [Bryobacteraceae bacterium]|nr:16S rRNA (adenine(1518)-N(6)/adenine(1519)-N(6))-dimethyltransferase RsmA [Bryobacteraceae bacterium]
MGQDPGCVSCTANRQRLTARPKLGQHFLIRGSTLERIAAAACPKPEAQVVEIGPGRGALTEKLLARAARVVAVEIDSDLADHLRRKFAGEERLEILAQDALETDFSQWGHASITGNLPYYVASPILTKVARLDVPRAVFLIQKEVAERLVAKPGERAYGFLTVQIALWMEARRLFEVKPAAFRPPPKVDSAVVLLEPRKQKLPVGDPDAFLAFVSLAFRHKRKTLRNNLAETYGKENVDRWPEASLRAEQLSLEQFLEIYKRLGALAVS